MSDIIEHLKRRVGEAEREYQNTVKKREDLIKLEQTLFQELRAYQTALAGEMRRAGMHVPEPEAKEHHPPQQPASGNGRKPSSVGETILGYIRLAAKSGLTRQEISSRLAADGIVVHKNYPYVVIGKLKEKGLIDVRNRKLFPNEKSG